MFRVHEMRSKQDMGAIAERREVPEAKRGKDAPPFSPEYSLKRGFKRIDDRCQVVQVPKHAFLNTWGDGWECERGFRRSLCSGMTILWGPRFGPNKVATARRNLEEAGLRKLVEIREGDAQKGTLRTGFSAAC